MSDKFEVVQGATLLVDATVSHEGFVFDEWGVTAEISAPGRKFTSRMEVEAGPSPNSFLLRADTRRLPVGLLVGRVKYVSPDGDVFFSDDFSVSVKA